MGTRPACVCFYCSHGQLVERVERGLPTDPASNQTKDQPKAEWNRDALYWKVPMGKKVVADTMVGGATLTKLIGTSAWYAPGAAGAALVASILRDEKKLFTCCVALDGEYGQSDICLGVPVTIGKNGWEKILPLELTVAEQEAFEKSAAAVRSMNEVLG